MIRYTQGDIFESGAQTLVNTVNCVGVMGKGLAKEFRHRYPSMYEEYRSACDRGEVRPGKPFLYRNLTENVLCLPTKDNWKGKAKYEFIDAGLRAVAEHYKEWGITSLAIPPLGCGLGGLEWPKVKTMIGDRLGDLPIEIVVYEPLGEADRIPSKVLRSDLSGKVGRAAAYIGEIIWVAGEALPAGTRLGRFLLQKIAYFAQMRGVPMGLKFTKYRYGPYTDSIRHIVDRLEGLYIRDASRTTKASDLRMLDVAAWEETTKLYREELNAAREPIRAAIELLGSVDLQRAELFSTVFYAWSTMLASGYGGDEDDVVAYIEEYVEDWKDGTFPLDAVRAACRELDARGWLTPADSRTETAPEFVGVLYGTPNRVWRIRWIGLNVVMRTESMDRE